MTESKSEAKQFTVFNALFRVVLMFTPIFGPYLLGAKGGLEIVIPFIWLVCMGPVACCVGIPNYEDWDESAKPFRFIFNSVVYLYVIMLVIGLGGWFIGGWRY